MLYGIGFFTPLKTHCISLFTPRLIMHHTAPVYTAHTAVTWFFLGLLRAAPDVEAPPQSGGGEEGGSPQHDGQQRPVLQVSEDRGGEAAGGGGAQDGDRVPELPPGHRLREAPAQVCAFTMFAFYAGVGH